MCSIHSPVCVLIVNDQQDLRLAYDGFGWLDTSCLSTFSSHCGRFGMCSGSNILGHLSALHHAGEGAEEAPGARSGAWARAGDRAWALTRDAGGLPSLCGWGGRRGSGWTRRARPLQVHHVAVGEVGNKAAVWQPPAEVVHGEKLVGRSGQQQLGRMVF